MINVSLVYGPHGLKAGDEHVAEILHRTVDGQPAAVASFRDRVIQLQSAGAFIPDDLPTLITVHAEWTTMLLWQMTTCYLDETVASCAKTQSDFAATVYTEVDSLCDLAAHWSRTAAQSRSLMAAGSRVRITQVLNLPPFTLSAETLDGVWAVYEHLMNHVTADSSTQRAIPVRLRKLYQELSKEVQIHVSMMKELRRSYTTTRLAQNKLDILREARKPAEDLFVLGQQLWAPFLLGPRYTEALRRPLALDELTIGFDPWILTDPRKKKAEEHRPESRAALAEFWLSVKDTPGLFQLAQDIAELRRVDAIRRRTGRGYPLVPWPSQFMVRRTISLGGRSFVPGDLIAYYARSRGGNIDVSVRKTGRITKPIELLGHASEEQL